MPLIGSALDYSKGRPPLYPKKKGMKKTVKKKSWVPYEVYLRRRQAQMKLHAKRALHMKFQPNECEVKYLTACAYPFAQGAIGACLPSFPAKDSQKYTSINRGTFSCGTEGNIGFIVISPCLANDAISKIHSTASYGQTVIYANSSEPNNARGTVHAPYNSATLKGTHVAPPTVSGRIVACALRIRYIGKEDQASGSILGIVDTNHGNLEGKSVANLAERPEVVTSPVSRDWITVQAAAVDRQEMEYPRFRFPESTDAGYSALNCIYTYSNGRELSGFSGDVGVGGAIMGFVIQGATAGAPYEYEYIQHNEYVGEGTQGLTSPNHVVAGSDERVLLAMQNSASARGDVRGGGAEILRQYRAQATNAAERATASQVASAAAKGAAVTSTLLAAGVAGVRAMYGI